jgi:hypothetical protein
MASDTRLSVLVDGLPEPLLRGLDLAGGRAAAEPLPLGVGQRLLRALAFARGEDQLSVDVGEGAGQLGTAPVQVAKLGGRHRARFGDRSEADGRHAEIIHN